jgi:hypothetical protein
MRSSSARPSNRFRSPQVRSICKRIIHLVDGAASAGSRASTASATWMWRSPVIFLDTLTDGLPQDTQQGIWIPLGWPATGSHPAGKATEAGNRRGPPAHRPQPASQIGVQFSPAHLPRPHLVGPYWPTPRRTQAPRSRSGRVPGRSRLPALGSSAPAQSRKAALASVVYGNTRSLRSRRAPLAHEALRPTDRIRAWPRG